MLPCMPRSSGPQRRSASLLLAALGCVLLSGCVQGESPKPKPTASDTAPPGKGPGQATPSNTPTVMQRRVFRHQQTMLQFDVLSLGRVNQTILKLKMKITNVGGIDEMLSPTVGNNNFSSFVLVDGQGMKAYYPLVSQQGTEMQHGYPDLNSDISVGDSITASIFYPAPPPNVPKVALMSPVFPAFAPMPIAPTAKVEPNEPDPTKIPLKPSDIENVTSISDDLGGDKSIDESGGKQDIRLNTDVLFALNKAVLSEKADGILKDVAKRIDKASVATIKVDGYTDNTGNDAINDPLSRRRATAVSGALKKLVTRDGVKFDDAGHGSSDPVASNKTADGRKKNRRVTVTIGK